MKIVRFDYRGIIGIGIVQDEGIIDLKKAGLPYKNILEIIDSGQDALQKIKLICDKKSIDHKLSEVQLLAPIPKPGKYLAIGMNYQKHLEESDRIGAGRPTNQLWFNKQTTCINDPFGAIDPGVTEKLDYEVELGVVIGKRAKNIKAEDALNYIFGYFVANDVSARDWQFHSPTFTMGKSFDTHGPIGPWIVTADEIKDPQNLELRCYVNGVIHQSSNTSMMIYTIVQQIEYLTKAFTLEPGDLIATGTPEGVGVAMEPPSFLKSGDIVRCEVDHIGMIENKVL